jgi:hypothetical protein
MTKLKASRTLVKSPPELWAECSDAASLTRHLDQFGEIRITRLEPETAVAWEGEHASGTVRLEPSGWGTRVVLTAEPEPGPPAESGGDPPPRGLMARMLAMFRRRRPSSAGLDASRDTLSAAAPDTEAALTAALDSLGQAHHRPFSRA